MANQAPGRDAAGGGRGVFRSQLQIQESREGHQEEVKLPTLESEDSESLSSASSIFQQGRVPISWLVSDSGSSAHDRSERASGGKDSQHTSSSSSAEQQAARLGGGRVQDLPDSLSGRGKSQSVQAGKTGYSSSSWFATTFEESEMEDLAATQEKKGSARGSGSSFGVLTGAALDFVSEQSGNSQTKEDEEIPEDVEQRCMDILMNLPLDDEGRVTSLGSQSHKSGTCKPCAYWFKRACKHGVACYNCHIAHEGQKPKRLRSSKAKIHKEIGDSSIPEEGELSQKDYKKNTADRAIPSTPGRVGGESVDLKVTAAVLKRVSMARGFKVTEPPSANYSVDPARSRTKTSL